MRIKMNQTQMVPVEWLMRHLSGSVDGVDFTHGFDRLIARKAMDMCFGPLVEAILDNGFTVPICVQSINGRFIQGNGHHRLAAAILLCLDEIAVYFTDDPLDFMCSSETEKGALPSTPEVFRVWQKLIACHVLDQPWCDEHDSPRDWCTDCYRRRKAKLSLA